MVLSSSYSLAALRRAKANTSPLLFKTVLMDLHTGQRGFFFPPSRSVCVCVCVTAGSLLKDAATSELWVL